MKTQLTYERFVDDNREYLKAFRDKHVYLAYAGGKDASVILHFFTRAREEFGFAFETHAGMFPTHVYTQAEVEKLDNYWGKRGIDIIWHAIPQSEDIFAETRRQGINPCEACHATKRKYFLGYINRTITDLNSMAIILGWSLWDIVSYTLEYQLGSLYSQIESMYQGKTMKDRFFRTAQRFYPMLKMKEGYTIYKPLLRYNDQEIRAVIAENDIPILTTDCKYKDFRPKRLYAESYIKMDYRFNYDQVMAFAHAALQLEEPSSYSALSKEEFITSVI